MTNSNIPYPYTRNEECAWQPEEVARRLGALPLLVSQQQQQLQNNDPLQSNLSNPLMTRGRNSGQVRSLRRAFGSNTLHGTADDDRALFDDNDDDDDDDADNLHRSPSTFALSSTFPLSLLQSYLHKLKSLFTALQPLLQAFIDQLKEPLIMMLLFSAFISYTLNNIADAISISIALGIVSMVAAIQEYRSERALEKLADLVPHTCTILRDGHAKDHFLAKELVVGDLVLLATGDRVPADVRIVDGVDMSVDESSLTGENRPVEKTGVAIPMISTATTTTTIGNDGAVRNNDTSHSPPPPLSEQKNIAFMGTLVVSGRGRGLVVAVGCRTEFGKVAKELSQVESRRSPLQTKIDELGRTLAFASGVGISVLALVGYILGRPLMETVTVAVSLAVAAIPEGLPICVAVTLALGVLRMARRCAIVKKLPAVETLGCATVVASDKTGTLTQNEMTARSMYCLAFPGLCFGLTGVGYDAKKSGGYLVRNASAEDLSSMKNNGGSSSTRQVTEKCSEFNALSALFGTASICNNATVSCDNDDGGNATPMGQPTEIALLIGSAKANVPDPRPMYHRVQEIPFSSDRKRMEVKCRPVGGAHCALAFTLAARRHTDSDDAASSSLYFVKGMPEAILGECRTHTAADGSAVPLTEMGKSRALVQARRMAACGLRVLAMAYGPRLDNLTFAGIIGLEDPPREGVVESVHQLEKGGVKVIMVTGDSKETAIAIARRCGILGGGGGRSIAAIGDEADSCLATMLSAEDSSDDEYLNINLMSSDEYNMDDVEFGQRTLSGAQLDTIGQHNLPDAIVGVKVFYRVAPRHKLALVRALQKNGEVVAMTGDGVNDALSLKAADIGIAMGKGGTDVAKEAADVVLADDDFTTIVYAVAEGKGIFFNIRNFLSFQLSTSFAAMLMEAVATAFRLPSPLNAMQILFINIIMDGPPAQSLGVEPVDEQILRAPPRKASESIVTRALLTRAVSSALLITFLTLCVFAHELDDGQVTRRDTTMTFMTFVNCDFFNAYACRSADKCFYEISPYSNPSFLWAMAFSVAGQLAVIYFPPLQAVFQTEALSLGDLFGIALLSSTVLLFDTIRKKFLQQYFSDNSRMMRSLLFKRKDSSAGRTRRRVGGKKGKIRIKQKVVVGPPVSGNGSTIRARNVATL